MCEGAMLARDNEPLLTAACSSEPKSSSYKISKTKETGAVNTREKNCAGDCGRIPI